MVSNQSHNFFSKNQRKQTALLQSIQIVQGSKQKKNRNIEQNREEKPPMKPTISTTTICFDSFFLVQRIFIFVVFNFQITFLFCDF